MKTTMTCMRIVVASLLFSFLSGSNCATKFDTPESELVNDWTFHLLSDVYLWNAQMGAVANWTLMDPKEYFDRLIYKPEDKWSFITSKMIFVETTFGYHLLFGRFNNSNYYFGIIAFVYPNSPAAKAGLKRGDIIYKVNGSFIDAKNYIKLYVDPKVSIQKGVLSGNTISAGATVNLTATKMELTSIIVEKVLEIGAKKIGYLCYSDFSSNSETELNGVFKRFKDAGVEDVVLDLRYNLGGLGSIAVHLGSILAPADVVNAEKVMVTYQWNEKYQKDWTDKGRYDQLRSLFDKKVPVNMNLNRLYVLTTGETASASEFVITGLNPYMEVIKIGETSFGKYVSASYYWPKYFSGSDARIQDWCIFAVTHKFANHLGITDCKNGFTPDYKVEDLLLEGMRPLGDPLEPLLGTAIGLIIGVPYVAAAPTTKAGSNFEINRNMRAPKDLFEGSILLHSFE